MAMKVGLALVLIAFAYGYIYNPEEHGSHFEGDIVLPMRKNALVGEEYKWPNGVIPYKIIGNFSRSERRTLCRAIRAYHKHTCIRFRPRRHSDNDYLTINNGNTGCWSTLGRVGGRQALNLESKECFSQKGTAIHEMMHILGFMHEQNRLDRDHFIKIKWHNIKKGHKMNFHKAKQPITAFGMPYDYDSILHYSSYSFSKNDRKTLVPKGHKRYHLGQREGFTCIDLKKINVLYGCTSHLRRLSKSAHYIFGGHPC